MKQLLFFTLIIFLCSCSEHNAEKEIKEIKTPEVLTEVKNGIYTEYYPGKKQVKIRGYQDSNKVRNGKWTYHSIEGKELSITYFENGLREGHTIVKRPNGVLNYVGEYRNDQMVGVWKFYDEKGNVKREKDYGKGQK